MIGLCPLCGEMTPRERTFCSDSCAGVSREILRSLHDRRDYLERLSASPSFGTDVADREQGAFRAGLSCALELIGIEQRMITLGEALGEEPPQEPAEPAWAHAS